MRYLITFDSDPSGYGIRPNYGDLITLMHGLHLFCRHWRSGWVPIPFNLTKVPDHGFAVQLGFNPDFHEVLLKNKGSVD